VRTYLDKIAAMTGQKISVGHRLFVWAVRHAGWSYTRFAIRRDKMTPYQALFGCAYVSSAVPFGETVHFKKQNTEGEPKTAPRCEKGVWVGRAEGTDEHLVMTTDGLKTARSIRRLTGPEQWKAEFLNKVRGLPWAPSEGRQDHVEEQVLPAPVMISLP
jgi:hypothetical protein